MRSAWRSYVKDGRTPETITITYIFGLFYAYSPNYQNMQETLTNHPKRLVCLIPGRVNIHHHAVE